MATIYDIDALKKQNEKLEWLIRELIQRTVVVEDVILSYHDVVSDTTAFLQNQGVIDDNGKIKEGWFDAT